MGSHLEKESRIISSIDNQEEMNRSEICFAVIWHEDFAHLADFVENHLRDVRNPREF